MPIFFPAASPILPPSAVVDLFDFDGSSANKDLFGNFSSGGSITIPSTTENGRFGIRQLSTGSTSTGRCAIARGLGSLILPSILWLWTCAIRVPTLSNSTQEYNIRVGLSDTTTGDFNNGLYAEYDRLNNGVDWFACKAVSGVREKIDTNVPVTTGWINFKIYGNNSFCIFKVNEVTIGSFENLPNALLGRVFQITKSAGTTARTMLIDYEMFGYVPENERPPVE